MQPALPMASAALFLALAGLTAPASAQEGACTPPVAIQSTRTMIPYPVISQRMGERGTTRLIVTLGADGTPVGVSIGKSSGSRRLDDAAAAHIEAYYRWEPLSPKCSPARKTVDIAVNWWLDPLPNPAAIAADAAGIEVIDVRGQCIHIWAYDGPVSSSGSSPCRAP